MRNIFNTIYLQISDKIGRVSRKIFRNYWDRFFLKNRNFTIISHDCVGGIIYSDLGLKFLPPTVNMMFRPDEFPKFCMNLEYYINQPIKFIYSDKNFPVGMLGDITIEFVHYKSEEAVLKKWNERKKRINYENLYFILSDRYSLSKESIELFNALPFKNKICFSSKPYENYKSVIYMEEYKNQDCVTSLVNFMNPFGKRRYQNNFDYINWLNGKGYK